MDLGSETGERSLRKKGDRSLGYLGNKGVSAAQFIFDALFSL
jgi:hypothetical protein